MKKISTKTHIPTKFGCGVISDVRRVKTTDNKEVFVPIYYMEKARKTVPTFLTEIAYNLTPIAFKVLAYIYENINNEDEHIILSPTHICSILNKKEQDYVKNKVPKTYTRETIGRAIKELVDYNFIVKTNESISNKNKKLIPNKFYTINTELFYTGNNEAMYNKFHNSKLQEDKDYLLLFIDD